MENGSGTKGSARGGRDGRGGRSGIAALPRRVVRTLGRLPVVGRAIGLTAADASGTAELERRIVVPVYHTWPERSEWREIERGFTALAEEGLWMSMLDRLRGVDQSRQRFASGRRYSDCALAGALRNVTRHLGRIPDVAQAMAALGPIQSLHATDRRDYMPAVLLARALIEIGWAMRGPMPPGQVSPEALRTAAGYFARAEEVIGGFDPIEENSPAVAETRYRLVPGIDGGADYLRDWYEDWADLDPSNPEMLSLHSRFLGPAWYGSLDEIDAEARRAVARAEEDLGEGAYAHFWRLPLESEPEALSRVDAELFLRGVRAALAQSQSQELANEYAALLFRLSLPRSTEQRDEVVRNAPVRELFAQGFSEVLRSHVQELHPPTWGMSETAVRRVVAAEFDADYAGGAILRTGTAGIMAEMPGEEDAENGAA